MAKQSREKLLDEFAVWIGVRSVPDADDLRAHAEMFLDWQGDYAGIDLADLDEADIREFLLDWCPRQFAGDVGESAQVCDAVAALADFLADTGRLGGGVRQGTALKIVAGSLVTAMEAAMANPANYGMAKTLFAGIENADSMSMEELQVELQKRVDEHNALPLEQRKALTDHIFEPEPEPEELPLAYVPPPEAEVAAVAEAARLPGEVEALRNSLGETGKALTAKGNLKLADGRVLVEMLDTGDVFDPRIGDKTFTTKSTATLPKLAYLLDVAELSGAVQKRKNRLVPVKAWSRKSAVTKAEQVFRTVHDYGTLSLQRRNHGVLGELNRDLDSGVVHWLSGLLPHGTEIAFDSIVELNERVLQSSLVGTGIERFASAEYLQNDIGQILEVLQMTGVIDWLDAQDVATRSGRERRVGGRIVLTAFGRHVLPEYLTAAGYALRTADDLTEVDLPGLIDAMDSIPHESHPSVLAAWKPSLTATERAAEVAALTGDAEDASTRLVGMRLLGMFDIEVAEPYIRQLLDTPAGGHAAIWLLDHDLVAGETVAGFITPAVMVDILSLLLDHPELLCEQFLGGHDPEQLLDFFWRHPAPETAPVLDALGEHLPDRRLAKAARKAAIKHRSWMANLDR